ncbi:MAG: hypothetical protein GYB32_08580 [Algicola sp.]|nr:hypothetical protein [Algicola sp.]
MKNITSLFATLILTLFMVSCENETTNNPSEVTEDLVSIQEIFMENSITNYTINNGLNTQIDYGSNSYQTQTFSNGKMVMIEYFNNGLNTGFESFEYDSSDRIVMATRSFIADNITTVRNYEYAGNDILATKSEYDDNDNLLNQTTYTFTLNANNRIVHYENIDGSAYWDASYTNGNLTGFTASGYGNDVDGTATFTYASELASAPYQKESYRYGSEWKNNVMLIQTGNYAFKQLAELGTNYLTGYTFTVTSDPNRTITLDVTYEFDNLGRLTEQAKTKMFFESLQTRVLTYEYQ